MLRAGETRSHRLPSPLIDRVVDVSGRASHDGPVFPRAVDGGPEPLAALLVNCLARHVVVAGEIEGDLLTRDGKFGSTPVDGTRTADAEPGLLRLVLGGADDKPEKREKAPIKKICLEDCTFKKNYFSTLPISTANETVWKNCRSF